MMETGDCTLGSACVCVSYRHRYKHSIIMRGYHSSNYIDLYTTISFESSITSVWMVQFQQFKHCLVAYNELFHIVCSKQK